MRPLVRFRACVFQACRHPWLSRWLLADSSSRPASSKPLKCSRSTRKRRRRCLFLRLASARHLPRLWSRVFKSPTFPLPATRATTSTRGSGARPPSPQPAATWLGFNFYKRPRTETASVSEALLLPVCVHPCVSNIQTTGCPSTAPPSPRCDSPVLPTERWRTHARANTRILPFSRCII